MKVNVNCHHGNLITIYLDGKRIDDCVEADDKSGHVIVAYRNAHGKIVPAIEAEKGAMVWQGLQVIKLHGDVRIEIDDAHDDIEFIRHILEESYMPLNIEQVS